MADPFCASESYSDKFPTGAITLEPFLFKYGGVLEANQLQRAPPNRSVIYLEMKDLVLFRTQIHYKCLHFNGPQLKYFGGLFLIVATLKNNRTETILQFCMYFVTRNALIYSGTQYSL